ncbi:hypothetical protein Rifp1Sym_af00390 [endosymbiont of Riftia pachyptila (vent Ph05)]|uniref:Uncharacterized protein n=1 Tax=endosymbiont of Riftia pachyptila (vent Ph05) TaxID=1048808 RepID=G2D9Z0_9GAMM|nr:hypothetical protein Rifp1Sym_af00390 [endosymbiont of Riftia pachyptila (vent Ph05)]
MLADAAAKAMLRVITNVFILSPIILRNLDEYKYPNLYEKSAKSSAQQ